MLHSITVIHNGKRPVIYKAYFHVRTEFSVLGVNSRFFGLLQKIFVESICVRGVTGLDKAGTIPFFGVCIEGKLTDDKE